MFAPPFIAYAFPCLDEEPTMLHTIVTAVAVLVVAVVVVAFFVLVVTDLRRTKGEPLEPDAQRVLDTHRDAERRVNKGAGRGWFY